MTAHARRPSTDDGDRGVPLWLAATACALAVAAAAVSALRLWHWPIEIVRVDEPLDRTDPQRLERTLARHADAGFFALNLEPLKARLERLPWVRAARLRRVWPNRLRLAIEEHVAAARWNGGALISEQGVVFAPGEADIDGLPRLRGPEGEAPAMLERLRTMRSQLGAIGPSIRGLHQDRRRSWRVELDNGVTLRLGQRALDDRLARFVAVWPATLAQRSQAIEAVDLRYTRGVAVAWRDGPPSGEQTDQGAGDV